MATIEKYTFQQVEIEVGISLPLKNMEELLVHEALDAIATACEAGELDNKTWVKQCFKTKKDFQDFLSELEDYNVCYRINDRWYQALQKLAGFEYGEEGFVSSEEIAEQLEKCARETGQVK